MSFWVIQTLNAVSSGMLLFLLAAGFTESVSLGELVFPSYRLLVIGVGIVTAVVLWWVQEKTRLGALIRAGVEDEEMARGMGTNIAVLFALVFAVGGALAGLSGVL